MTHREAPVVTGKDGRLGVIIIEDQSSETETSVLLYLDSGQEIVVPRDALILQSDDSYYLPVSLTELEQKQGEDGEVGKPLLQLPVLAEELRIQTQRVETGRVRITKVVREQEEIVDEPLLREEVRIERVPVGRLVDSPPPQRQEGDTTIIPILEEILVIEKRLFFREEVRVTKERRDTHRPQQVRLRREEAIVERIDTQEQPLSASGARVAQTSEISQRPSSSKDQTG
jgi:uncharacterized protein (TIGR02271 family)